MDKDEIMNLALDLAGMKSKNAFCPFLRINKLGNNKSAIA